MADDSKPTIITRAQMQGIADVQKHLHETGALPNGDPVYTKMEPHILLEALGDDALKWATAFSQHAYLVQQRGENVLDVGWLTTWFANAIEHSSDVRRWRAKGEDYPTPKTQLQ